MIDSPPRCCRIGSVRCSIHLLSLAAMWMITAPMAPAQFAPPEKVVALAERLPVLDPSEKGCPPFIARGSMPSSDTGYDYEVIWSDKTFRMTLFDPDDGTPLSINTLADSVALDLFGGTLYRFPGGRFDVSVVSNWEGNGLLATTVQTYLDGSGATPERIRFDIRDAVIAARDRSIIKTLEDGSTSLTQQVDQDRIRVIFFDPPPSRNIRFGQTSVKDEQYTSYHELILDGIDFSDPSLAAPDFKKAGFVTPGGDGKGRDPMPFFAALSGINSFPKLGLIRRGIRGDEAARESVEKLNIKWDEVAQKNTEMVPEWIEKLNSLEVTLTPPNKPWVTTPGEPVIRRNATTQPSR